MLCFQRDLIPMSLLCINADLMSRAMKLFQVVLKYTGTTLNRVSGASTGVPLTNVSAADPSKFHVGDDVLDGQQVEDVYSVEVFDGVQAISKGVEVLGEDSRMEPEGVEFLSGSLLEP